MSMDAGQVTSKGVDVNQLITSHRSGVIQGGSNVSARQGTGVASGGEKAQGSNFADVLKSKVEGLKFSAHASTRIKSRNIDLTPEIMNKLETAVSDAATKGAKDSLVLMKDLAFIVNIPNRTVITAMDGESIKDNVFTNIDSTVIAG
jgi:flagellar operon protein